MAISFTAAAISSMKSDPMMALASPSSSQMPSSLSSLRFPHQLRHFRIGNRGFSSRSRPRIRPLVEWIYLVNQVEVKKQTFSTFDELLASSEKPVLVDFYATWCGPCQMMVPVLNEVSAALEDTVQVVKIDTEKYPSIANKYGIEALPTFILFQNGEPCDRFEGALTANQLIQRVETTLKVKQ